MHAPAHACARVCSRTQTLCATCSLPNGVRTELAYEDIKAGFKCDKASASSSDQPSAVKGIVYRTV
eukprot:5256412-Pleurochrysis_carterae.AAC.1